MAEATGEPSSPPATPQGTNPWIIIIVVIVVLCCLCVGTIGLLVAFGEPILNELGLIHALLPTQII